MKTGYDIYVKTGRGQFDDYVFRGNYGRGMIKDAVTRAANELALPEGTKVMAAWGWDSVNGAHSGIRHFEIEVEPRTIKAVYV